jgi:DNA-binding PadR family transcriptional regulator
MAQPTSTTYALLALLAIRSWTGYELTQQAGRSLHYAWPRSEAHLYNEQKRLVRLGWASVEAERVGRRTRNRYTIAERGRAALREWLATAPQGPRLEIEGLLRLFFADGGEVIHIVKSLRETADAARNDLDQMLAYVQDYLKTGGPFPERLHLIALSVELTTDLLARIEEFSSQAADEIARWPTTQGLGMTPETKDRLERVLARHRAQLLEDC